MPVLVCRENLPTSPIGSRALARHAQKMLVALELADAELSLLVCDDATIQTLNRRHRRKNKPTDVLAFAMREGQDLAGEDGRLLGDVVISLETAVRQAREQRRALWHEVDMLLAHGLLHLIGYDHRTDAEERAMNQEVARLMTQARSRTPTVARAGVDKRRAARSKWVRTESGSKPKQSQKRVKS